METENLFPSHVHVEVHPFTRQREGDDLIIGRADLGSFAAVPAVAVEILDDLAAGRTVGEARELFRLRHGEEPDLEEFLRAMAAKGLVRPARTAGPAAAEPERQQAPPRRGLRFSWISRRVAERLFSAPALWLHALLIAAGVLALLAEPGLFPGRHALYFAEHRTLKTLTVLLLGYATLLIHELGHLLAARAIGVDASLGIGNRLWVLVAETDLTGLWTVPKRRRYLPLLAGAMVDASSASLLILLLGGAQRFGTFVPASILEIGGALVVVYALRLLWQCLFFVRTDFYYVLAGLFDCKNLLGDTEAFLRNGLVRLFPRIRTRDLSGLPAAERRIIAVYSAFWLLGRAVAFWTLFFVTLPLFAEYWKGVRLSLRAGFDRHPYEFLDAIALTILFFIPLVAGLVVWIAGLYRSWRMRWSLQAKSYV